MNPGYGESAYLNQFGSATSGAGSQYSANPNRSTPQNLSGLLSQLQTLRQNLELQLGVTLQKTNAEANAPPPAPAWAQQQPILGRAAVSQLQQQQQQQYEAPPPPPAFVDLSQSFGGLKKEVTGPSDTPRIMDTFGHGEMKRRRQVSPVKLAKKLSHEVVAPYGVDQTAKSSARTSTRVYSAARKLEDIRSAMRDLDKKTRGSIRTVDLSQTLSNLRSLEPQEVAKVVSSFDKDGKGVIDYSKFVNLVAGRDVTVQRALESMQNPNPNGSVSSSTARGVQQQPTPSERGRQMTPRESVIAEMSVAGGDGASQFGGTESVYSVGTATSASGSNFGVYQTMGDYGMNASAEITRRSRSPGGILMHTRRSTDLPNDGGMQPKYDRHGYNILSNLEYKENPWLPMERTSPLRPVSPYRNLKAEAMNAIREARWLEDQHAAWQAEQNRAQWEEVRYEHREPNQIQSDQNGGAVNQFAENSDAAPRRHPDDAAIVGMEAGLSEPVDPTPSGDFEYPRANSTAIPTAPASRRNSKASILARNENEIPTDPGLNRSPSPSRVRRNPIAHGPADQSATRPTSTSRSQSPYGPIARRKAAQGLADSWHWDFQEEERSRRTPVKEKVDPGLLPAAGKQFLTRHALDDAVAIGDQPRGNYLENQSKYFDQSAASTRAPSPQEWDQPLSVKNGEKVRPTSAPRERSAGIETGARHHLDDTIGSILRSARNSEGWWDLNQSKSPGRQQFFRKPMSYRDGDVPIFEEKMIQQSGQSPIELMTTMLSKPVEGMADSSKNHDSRKRSSSAPRSRKSNPTEAGAALLRESLRVPYAGKESGTRHHLDDSVGETLNSAQFPHGWWSMRDKSPGRTLMRQRPLSAKRDPRAVEEYRDTLVDTMVETSMSGQAIPQKELRSQLETIKTRLAGSFAPQSTHEAHRGHGDIIAWRGDA